MRTAVCALGLIVSSALALPAAADDAPAAAPTAEETAAERLDNAGHVGIGYQASLGGARGLAIRYGAGPVVLSGILGLRLISPDADDQETRYGAEVALGVAVPFQRWDGTHFGLGARAAIGVQHVMVRNEAGELVGADPFGLAFELPLYVEAWLSKRITLIVETGVSLNIVGDEGSPLQQRPAGIVLGLGTGGLFGSAGLCFYF